MATLVRWEPFREIATLQNEMSRLMNDVLGNANGETTSSRTWVPAVDVWETEKELVYAFDLPGIPEDKVSVEFEDGALIVTAERERSHETSEENFYRFERRFGTFARTIGLPQGVTEDAVRADYKDGVLEVHVAKPEQPKPRRISIGTGNKKTIEGSAKKS
jgi:HSP20 family protein